MTNYTKMNDTGAEVILEEIATRYRHWSLADLSEIVAPVFNYACKTEMFYKVPERRGHTI